MAYTRKGLKDFLRGLAAETQIDSHLRVTLLTKAISDHKEYLSRHPRTKHSLEEALRFSTEQCHGRKPLLAIAASPRTEVKSALLTIAADFSMDNSNKLTQIEMILSRYSDLIVENHEIRAIIEKSYREVLIRLVKELTDLAGFLFSRIREKDLLSTQSSVLAPKSHTDIAIAFNNLSNTVAEQIVTASGLKQKSIVLERWVAIMQECLERGDFHSAHAIIFGIGRISTKDVLYSSIVSNISGHAKTLLEDTSLFASYALNKQAIMSEMAQLTPIIPDHATIKNRLDKSMQAASDRITGELLKHTLYSSPIERRQILITRLNLMKKIESHSLSSEKIDNLIQASIRKMAAKTPEVQRIHDLLITPWRHLQERYKKYEIIDFKSRLQQQILHFHSLHQGTEPDPTEFLIRQASTEFKDNRILAGTPPPAPTILAQSTLLRRSSLKLEHSLFPLKEKDRLTKIAREAETKFQDFINQLKKNDEKIAFRNIHVNLIALTKDKRWAHAKNYLDDILSFKILNEPGNAHRIGTIDYKPAFKNICGMQHLTAMTKLYDQLNQAENGIETTMQQQRRVFSMNFTTRPHSTSNKLRSIKKSLLLLSTLPDNDDKGNVRNDIKQLLDSLNSTNAPSTNAGLIRSKIGEIEAKITYMLRTRYCIPELQQSALENIQYQFREIMDDYEQASLPSLLPILSSSQTATLSLHVKPELTDEQLRDKAGILIESNKKIVIEILLKALQHHTTPHDIAEPLARLQEAFNLLMQLSEKNINNADRLQILFCSRLLALCYEKQDHADQALTVLESGVDHCFSHDYLVEAAKVYKTCGDLYLQKKSISLATSNYIMAHATLIRIPPEQRTPLLQAYIEQLNKSLTLTLPRLKRANSTATIMMGMTNTEGSPRTTISPTGPTASTASVSVPVLKPLRRTRQTLRKETVFATYRP